MEHLGCHNPPTRLSEDSVGVRGGDQGHEVVAGQSKMALFAVGESAVGENMGDDSLEDAGSCKACPNSDNVSCNESPSVECLGSRETLIPFFFSLIGIVVPT